MSKISKTTLKLNENKIKKYSQNSIWHKFLLEVFGAFSIVFIINFFISLGEANIPFFWIFNNVVAVEGFWIATWTFLFFLFFEKTGVSSNALTLIIDFRNKNINFKQYILLFFGQLMGAILSSLFVFALVQLLIVNNSKHLNNIHVMGGAIPYIKGLFTNKGTLAWNPIDFNMEPHGIGAYGFSSIQGLINALIIIFSFFVLKSVEKKYNIGFISKLIRYIMLLSLVTSSVILTANTTNYNRLISPAIIDMIFNQSKDAVRKFSTTCTFICLQSLGLIVVYFSGFFDKEDEVLTKVKGEQNGI